MNIRFFKAMYVYYIMHMSVCEVLCDPVGLIFFYSILYIELVRIQ